MVKKDLIYNPDISSIYPMSEGQKGLWLIYQIAPKNTTYNEYNAVKINSPLDIETWKVTWQKIVERHAILRTTYGTDNKGEPVQIVHRTMNVPMQVIDAKNWSEEQLKQEIFTRADILYDLEKDPIIRLYLFQLSATELVQLFTIHQIANDSFTKDLLLKEFQQLYAGIPVKKPLAYTDFVKWESEMLKSAWGEKLWQYWEKQLAGELPILDLPKNRPRPSLVTYRCDSHEFKLNEELVSRLKQLKSDSLSLFQITLSAFYVLLYRYTNKEDIIVNIPTENRQGKKEFKDVAGNLASLVVVRGNLEGNTTFKELLIQVAQTVEEAFKNEIYNYPLSQLVKQLKQKNNCHHSLVSSVMFNWRKLGWYETEFPEGLLQIEPYLLAEQCSALYDIFVEIVEVGDELNVRWNYNSDLFNSETIERMGRHYLTLLEGIVANLEMPIFQLPLLTESERHQLLIEWNNTTVDYPQDKCIHQLFEEQVEKTPDAVAVVFDSEQLTYQELNCRANQLAHYLQKLGVKPESLVGICVERSLEMIVGLLGILKAGGAYVPIDPTYPTERISYMLENSQVPILLTQSHFKVTLPEYSGRLIGLDSDWEIIATETEENPVSVVTSQNFAYVIYTSGSTGKPKGVLVPHQGLCNLAKDQIKRFDVKTNSRWLQFFSISFDGSIWEIVMALCSGAQLCLVSPGTLRLGSDLQALLEKHSITHIALVPSALATLPCEDLPALQTIIVGGEACPQDLVEKWSKGRRFFNAYGPTEYTVCATVSECSDRNQKPSIGRPIANTQIYILNNLLQPVPIGAIGELYIGGSGVARGYLDQKELTQEKFIPNPFVNSQFPIPNSQENRLYKTGDLARYLPNGEIEFLGRIDYQVKIRGLRIELGEIEAAIGQHPDIREAVVIAREDIPGDRRLVAYIVPSSNVPSINELRDFFKQKLPDYMVPSAFVILEKFPLTPNGKIDRRALPTPCPSSLTNKTNFVAPRNEVEMQLAEIWSEVLSISPIGVQDNFIELGGHSLLATKIIGEVRDRFQVELPLNRLFEFPTVAELAKEIIPLKEFGIRASLQPISRDRTIPLSFAQEQLWFLNQLMPEKPVYNETLSIHLGRDINIPALEESLTELIRRHEILRTTYPLVNSQPCQEIQQTSTFTLPIVDLRELSETKRETEAVRIATEQLRERFDLNRGSLVRATLIQLTSDSYRLYFAIHHILVDAESFIKIVQELEIIYTAFSQGLPSPLAELPIQYADFAVWQRQQLQGEVLSHQLAYWEKKLENLPQLQLPTDRPRTPQTTFTGSFLRHRLSLDLIEKLKTLSRKESVTLFVTFATAIKVLLYRYSAQEDIVLGTVISQRDRPELEGIMGNFLNTLVLRSDLSGNPNFSEVLKRVRNVCLSAYSHQDVPFQKVVEALHPDSQVNQNPMCQVFFTIDPPLITEDKLGWKAFHFEVDPKIAKFDLTFCLLEEESEGMVLLTEYNTDLFDATTIKRMSVHLSTLLEGVVTNPNSSISELPLLTESERHQLLVEWNNTQVDYPQDKCIHQLFEEQVEKTPDAVAVVFEEQELTYRELNNRANQLAHYLQSEGVGAEVLVGICVERSLEMIVGLLGIMKAGGAYLPIDPTYSSDRISYMLENSQVPILLTQSHLKATLLEYPGSLIGLDSDWEIISCPVASVLYREGRSRGDSCRGDSRIAPTRDGRCFPNFYTNDTNGHDIIPTETEENPVSGVTSQNLAYVIYTSGSTGKPKGVLVPHQGLCNLAKDQIQRFDVKTTSRVLQFFSMSFDGSIWEIVMALCSGARLYLVPPESSRLGSDLKEQLQKHSITHITLVPSALATLPCEDLPALQTIIVAGETCPQELVQKWSKRQRFFNAYGPTEYTVCATVSECSDRNQKPSIGRPIANTQIYILDSDLQPVPIGVPGELHIGGDGLVRGYLHRPELTEEKFIPNPFDKSKVKSGATPRRRKTQENAHQDNQNSKLYKTGDLARYLPDGNIEFLGRIDNQVKIRGFRIELGEIEAVVAQHSNVSEVVVIVREDIPGDKRLVAYLITNGEKPTINNLRSFLKTKLPEYMIPAAFVLLKTMPLTPNGKIDRRALPTPDRSSLVNTTNPVAPRTSQEEQIARIWAKVLGVEKIGIHENFFDLGGNSLQATSLVFQLSVEMNLKISVKLLFEHPTIAELAESLSHLQKQIPSSAKVEKSMTASLTPNPEESLFLKVEQRSLLSLFAVGKIASIDSVSLGYLPLSLLKENNWTRNEILQDFDNLPMWVGVTETQWGRIGELILPIFEDELYSDPQKLVEMTVEALEMAGRLGAKAVALTGLIPSATDYGRAILKAIEGRNDLPKITTGHATTCSAVVLNIKKILQVSQRSLENEKVAFIGLGSIGLNSLRLMLKCLPHPSKILLCDIYSKLESIQNIQRELSGDLGFQGSIQIATSSPQLPPEIYDATLIIGATNVPDILDIKSVKPGTLIVDDSGPHCFSPEQAIKRFEEQKDILFTEGGALQAPNPMKTVIYLPKSIKNHLNETSWKECYAPSNPVKIMGCGLSSLLSSRFDHLEPTVGLLNIETCVQHYQGLEELGFEAADLHCGGYMLQVESKSCS